MRKYRSGAGSTIRVNFGIELVEGLAAFPQTTPLAAAFEQLNDRLQQAYLARMSTQKPFRKARAALRIAEFQAEQEVRKLLRAAEAADGGRRGPLAEALFPVGIGPVVDPAGSSQPQPVADLIDRLTKSSREGMAALGDEWKSRLEAVHGRLLQALDTYQSARRASYDAFTTELALRDEHELAVERIMGAVRGAFPKDRARQDIVFPAVVSGSRGGNDPDDEDEPDESKPA
ncbi:MAG: hypothetical protein HYV63_10700 [Candidatus Schekmanbacteria bacterium]|nr:hypothetical protein [Candidatus Schekmanbacteria bacterium]